MMTTYKAGKKLGALKNRTAGLAAKAGHAVKVTGLVALGATILTTQAVAEKAKGVAHGVTNEAKKFADGYNSAL